jgi:hypothetical protein
MLSSMQTIEVNDLVSASFEACSAFGAPGDGTPVCAACGWLEAEHDLPGAEVHVLPRRARSGPTPRRIAS